MRSTLHTRMLAGITILSSVFLISAIAKQTQVYIGTGSDGIYSSWLDTETGKLSEPKLAAKVDGSNFIVIHPNQKHLYSCAKPDNKTGAVFSYNIAEDGSLTETSQQTIQGRSLCHISIDAHSKVLLGANYGEGNVVSLPIEENGRLGKLVSFQQHEGSSVHPSRQTKPHAHSIYSGPANKFAYAPDLGIDKVMIYALDASSAKLTPSGFAKSPAGAGPRHMKFSKDGKQAYVLNELTVDVSVFNRDPETGKLSLVETVSTLPEKADKERITCSEIRVSQDGKFVYCANRDTAGKGRDSLSAFSVQDGKITLIQNIAANAHIPRNINLDPSGKWLLLAGQKANHVSVFQVDTETGKLTSTEHKIDVPRAMCIEFRK